MKNHWVQLAQANKAVFWTAELISYGSYLIKPRRVELSNWGRDASDMLFFIGSQAGLVFETNSVLNNDIELQNFLTFVSYYGMSSLVSKLKSYSGIQSQEFYELQGLTYINWNNSWSTNQIELVFVYAKLLKTNS